MDVLWLIGLSLSASLPAPSEPEPSAIHSTLSDLPLTFESNQGQTTFSTTGGGVSDAWVTKLTGNTLAGAPANEGSEGQSDDEGGGSIDVFLAILLAQFALARALRQRVRPATMKARRDDCP